MFLKQFKVMFSICFATAALLMGFSPLNQAQATTKSSIIKEKPVVRVNVGVLPEHKTIESLSMDSILVVRATVLKRLKSRELLIRYENIPESKQKEVRDFLPPFWVTDSVSQIEEILAGADEGLKINQAIKVQQLGGETSEYVFETENNPLLEKRSEVVLFLNRYIDSYGRGTDKYQVIGNDEGHLIVTDGWVNASANWKGLNTDGRAFSGMSLEELRTKINNVGTGN